MYAIRNLKLKNGKWYPCLVSVEVKKETGVFPVKTAKLQKSSQVYIYFREIYIYTHTYYTNKNNTHNQLLVLQRTTVKSIVFKQPQKN